MDQKTITTIIVTAILTAVANNVFSFIRERKISSFKYAEETLTIIYIPILTVMDRNYYPGDGYNGLDAYQVREIKNILDSNRQFVEPRIEYIIESYAEEMVYEENENRLYDLDRQLLYEVLFGFNKIRKSLGLPYEKKFVSSFNYRVYTLLHSLMHNIKYKFNKRKKKNRKFYF